MMYSTYPKSTRLERTLRKYSLLLIVLVCFVPLQAQMQVGDVEMNMSGNIGFGYSGGFGTVPSSHGQSFVGDGYLTGSYYNPNFLSFNVRPYFDRNQSNGFSQITSHDNGIDAGVDFFRGSHFPGSVSYNKNYNSTGEFGLPGASGLVTDGSGQSFRVSWAELLPGLPPVYATFVNQNNSYSAIGTTGENRNASKLFTLNSNYILDGFNLTGNLTHNSQTFDFPNYLGLTNFTGGGGSTTYGATAQHALPLHGSFSLGWSHSNYSSDFNGGMDASSTSTGAGIGFIPWTRLQISSNVNYTTNVSGAINQNLITQGALPILNTSQDSNSLQFSNSASLLVFRGLTLNGHASQTTVSFLGHDYSNTQYGGTANYRYNQRLLGMLYFSFGAVDNADKQGNTNMGFIGNVGLNRKIGRWETTADAGYSQDVQTIIGIDTTSTFNYGGTVRRKINEETYWGGSFRATHTALVRMEGEGSSSESISTSLSWKRYAGAATYSQSSGTSVLTANGLLNPTPVAPLLSDNFVFFNARSFGLSGSSAIGAHFRVGANYTKVHSDNSSFLLKSISQAELYNVRAEYKVRKLSFIGGYSRVDQGLSTTNDGIPAVVNSFYLSITRWFNVF